LAAVLSSGAYVYDNGGIPSLLFGRALVGQVNGLRIQIFPREHAPAHFHVSGPDVDASFQIEDGAFLQGTISAKDAALVRYWYRDAMPRLIEVWNATRPSNCKVGKLPAP
jgi:hypothetical protein